jgi:riboflavin kinase/FMN adenylyltransferase
MQIFRKLEEIPAGFGPSVVSVGNFDGVHRAHQLVLQRVVEQARLRGAHSLAVTFEPHPLRILRPEAAPRLLTPGEIKLRMLAQSGLDAVLALPFTRDFSLLTAREFAEQILVRRLRALEVHEGANFRFGHRAGGNVQQLAELGAQLGFEVKIYPELKLRGDSVSSSRIRELLAAGRVGRARALLGRPFSVVSHPGRGRGLGARYTVPTINLSDYNELLPANGVYITRTRVGDESFNSVANLGVRPTFGADSFAVESHLLNFHPLQLEPHTEVELCFLRRLREERKFPSPEALRQQILRDAARAQHFFDLEKRLDGRSRSLAEEHAAG